MESTSPRITALREPDLERAPPLPPANTEAEQALLGAVLINNAAWHRVSEFLRPEHFANAVHGRIYDAIGKLIERGGPANPVTLKNLFDQDGALVDIGGAHYLAQLAQSAVMVVNAEFYGRAIHDLYLRRELIVIGQEVVSRAYTADLDDDAEKQIADVEGRLTELTLSATTIRRPSSLQEAVERSLAQTQHAYSAQTDYVGVSSGIKALDRIIGGFIGGEFILIGGRPGAGKSALLNSITWAALLGSVPVHIFSGEMRAPELAARLLAAMSGVSASAQRRGDLSGPEFDALLAARQSLQDWRCLIDDAPMALGRIRQQARAIKRRLNTGLLFIDTLQLVRIGTDENGGGGSNRNFEVGRVSNALKALAMDLDIPIIALAHLSRDLERRDDKRPMLADLRESGSLEQDANVVVFIYRDEIYLEAAKPIMRERESDIDFQERWSKWKNALEASRGKAELLAAKVRHDKPGTAHVIFDGARSFFHDPVDEQHPLI